MNWLHLSQTSSVRNTSDGEAPDCARKRVPGRSEQGKPWPGPQTWAAIISMLAFGALRMITLPRGYIYKVQSTKDHKKQKTPDTSNIETQQGGPTHHIPKEPSATIGERQLTRPLDAILERNPKRGRGSDGETKSQLQWPHPRETSAHQPKTTMTPS